MDAFDELLAQHPELADLASPADVLPPSTYRYFPPRRSFLDDAHAVEPPPRCEIEFPYGLLTNQELVDLRAQVGRRVHIRTEGPTGPRHHEGVLLAVERCERGCHIRLTLQPEWSPPWG